MMQGFLFGKPMPAWKVIDFLRVAKAAETSELAAFT
jgi:sensor c-di-GMP phosphodiesterase-like protein